MNDDDVVSQLYEASNLLHVKEPVLHGAWREARQGEYDVYEAAAGLYTLAFYRSTEYELIGRLRRPAGTRRGRIVRLYVGRQWEATRSYTLYDRGIIGESGKATDRLGSLTRSIEAAASWLLGITDVKWNRY